MLLTEAVLISVPLLCPRQETQLCLSSVRLLKVWVGELETQICSEGVSIIWRSERYHCTNRLSKKQQNKNWYTHQTQPTPLLPPHKPKVFGSAPQKSTCARRGEWHTHTHTLTDILKPSLKTWLGAWTRLWLGTDSAEVLSVLEDEGGGKTDPGLKDGRQRLSLTRGPGQRPSEEQNVNKLRVWIS